MAREKICTYIIHITITTPVWMAHLFIRVNSLPRHIRRVPSVRSWYNAVLETQLGMPEIRNTHRTHEENLKNPSPLIISRPLSPNAQCPPT